jgi:hypothetical protein
MGRIRKTNKLASRDPKYKTFKKYALDILEKHEVKHLFKFKSAFVEFWERYCATFDFPLSEVIEAQNMPKKIGNYLRRIKSEGMPKVIDAQNIDNYLVVSYQDRIRKKKKLKKETQSSKEIEMIEETTDEITDTFYRKKKKIVEINFTSEITTSTVARIQQAVTFKELLTRDYFYYNAGGNDDYEILKCGAKRKRFKEQLSHLEITKKVRSKMQKLTTKLMTDFDSVSDKELNEVNKKLNTLKKIIDGARDIDLQALDFLAKMSDDDFSTQKALNGAIINDQTMMTNGQLTIKGDKKPEALTPDNLKEDLKALGGTIFDQQLETIEQSAGNQDLIEGDFLAAD